MLFTFLELKYTLAFIPPTLQKQKGNKIKNKQRKKQQKNDLSPKDKLELG